jgi:hypothetical protein
MLRQRRDALERLTVSSALPVRLEFRTMESRRLAHEPQRAVR